jgi:hypothetical protein
MTQRTCSLQTLVHQTYWVIHHIHSIPFCETKYFLPPLWVTFIVYAFIRSKALGDIQFLFRARSGDHFGTNGFSDLHSHQPKPPRRRMNKYSLAFFQSTPHYQGTVADRCCGCESGCFCEIPMIWDMMERRLLDRNLFRIRTEPAAKNAIALRKCRRFWCRNNDTSKFKA